MFEHLEFFYLAVLGITSSYCFRTNTSDSFLCLLILWLLFITAQIPELWESPRSMASMHAGVFFLTLGGLHNGVSIRMQVLTTSMTVTDAAWVIFSYIAFSPNALNFPQDLFWWQSLINLLFLAMCATVIVGCRNTLKLKSYRARNLNARFMARQSEEIAGEV